MEKRPKKEKGTTMIEMMFYAAILAVISGVVVMFIINVMAAYQRVSAVAVIESNGKAVIRAVENEAKFATGIYSPTSVFGVATSQISFATNFNLPTGETSTYVDFYLDNQKIYMKREGSQSLAITSDNVSVSNFLATQMGTNSIRINLSLQPRLQKAVVSGEKNFIFSATLRGAYP